jgi:endogenous inhibitor of DNA gyrase (YacG/DUF329 family)
MKAVTATNREPLESMPNRHAASVTATNYRSETKITSCNAPSDETWRWHEARHRPTCCDRCDRPLTSDEPVWQMSSGYAGYSHRRHRQIVCASCAAPPKQAYGPLTQLAADVELIVAVIGPRYAPQEHPCATCARPVWCWAQRTRRIFCSRRCEWTHYNRRQQARRAAARPSRPCAVCTRPFVPRRGDATTCSPACRQRAYRQRQQQQHSEHR